MKTLRISKKTEEEPKEPEEKEVELKKYNNIVCFSDEEGWGYFWEHYNQKNKKIFGEKENTLFVFMGDAVDRAGKNELKLLKLLLELHREGKALLLAGNRDVTKLRLRTELSMTMYIDSTPVNVFDVLSNIMRIEKDKRHKQEENLELLVKVIVKSFKDLKYKEMKNDTNTFLKPEGTKEEEEEEDKEMKAYAYIALAYQWLTIKERNLDRPIIEEETIIRDLNYYLTTEKASIGWSTKESILNNFWKTKENKDTVFSDILKIHNNEQNIFMKKLRKNLNIESLLRVPMLLNDNYGININNRKLDQWISWSKEALIPDNNYLYVGYLKACQPFYVINKFKHTLFFSHSIPSKNGIDIGWGDENKTVISTSSLPIQQVFKPDEKRIVNLEKCNRSIIPTLRKTVQHNCNCIYKNKLTLQILKEYDRIFNDFEGGIMKLASQATGIEDDVDVYYPHKLKRSNTTEEKPEFKSIQCFLKKYTNPQNIIFVHGHKPFAIPYSSPIIAEDGKETGAIRISVDVSRDHTYTGDQRDNKKNWAYVTFEEDKNNELSISAIGNRHDENYTIADVRRVNISDEDSEKMYIDNTKTFPVVKSFKTLNTETNMLERWTLTLLDENKSRVQTGGYKKKQAVIKKVSDKKLEMCQKKVTRILENITKYKKTIAILKKELREAKKLAKK